MEAKKNNVLNRVLVLLNFPPGAPWVCGGCSEAAGAKLLLFYTAFAFPSATTAVLGASQKWLWLLERAGGLFLIKAKSSWAGRVATCGSSALQCVQSLLKGAASSHLHFNPHKKLRVAA